MTRVSIMDEAGVDEVGFTFYSETAGRRPHQVQIPSRAQVEEANAAVTRAAISHETPPVAAQTPARLLDFLPKKVVEPGVERLTA